MKKKISIPGSLNKVTTSFNKWQLQNSKKSQEWSDRKREWILTLDFYQFQYAFCIEDQDQDLAHARRTF